MTAPPPRPIVAVLCKICLDQFHPLGQRCCPACAVSLGVTPPAAPPPDPVTALLRLAAGIPAWAPVAVAAPAAPRSGRWGSRRPAETAVAERRAAVAALRAEGKSLREISAVSGYSPSTVHRDLNTPNPAVGGFSRQTRDAPSPAKACP